MKEKVYSEKEIWDSLDERTYSVTNCGLNYMIDDFNNIICFIYDSCNLFILDDDNYVLWLSPASSFEKIEYKDSIVLSFLIDKNFFCEESIDGYIIAYKNFNIW